MTTIRLHSFTGTNPGTDDCDFRGNKFIGASDGDHHHTLLEKDVEDDSPLIEIVKELGPDTNRLLDLLVDEADGELKDLLAGNKLRVGIWDKTAPGD